jgi:hypothetical protein
MNPYIDMPLPIGTRIHFGFLPEPSEVPAFRRHEEAQARAEVNRALGPLIYNSDLLPGPCPSDCRNATRERGGIWRCVDCGDVVEAGRVA